MSIADAARSEEMRERARERWRQQGDPVLSRSVQTVVDRHADLSEDQLADLREIAGRGE